MVADENSPLIKKFEGVYVVSNCYLLYCLKKFPIDQEEMVAVVLAFPIQTILCSFPNPTHEIILTIIMCEWVYF